MSDSGIGYTSRRSETEEIEGEKEECCTLCNTEMVVGSKRMSLNSVVWALVDIAEETGEKVRDLFAKCILNGTDPDLIRRIFGIDDEKKIGSNDIYMNIQGEEGGSMSLHAFQTNQEIRKWLMSLTRWRKKIRMVLNGEN